MNDTLMIWSISGLVFVTISLLAWALLQSAAPAWRGYRTHFTHQAQGNLAELFLFVDPLLLFYINIAALLLLPALLWVLTGNPVIAGLALLALAFLPRKIYRWLKERRLRMFQSQLPDALMMLAGSLKAGTGLTPALEALVRDAAPPLSQEFSLVLREQRLGVELDTALAHTAERVNLSDFDLVVAAIRISKEVGGNLAESLGQVAETVRRRLSMEGKIRSLTAQGRLQGIVMALIPALMVAFLSWRYPDVMGHMFHTRIGLGIISIALVMEYLGYRMCCKIMAIDI
jgi:tight adherence protein B